MLGGLEKPGGNDQLPEQGGSLSEMSGELVGDLFADEIEKTPEQLKIEEMTDALKGQGFFEKLDPPSKLSSQSGVPESKGGYEGKAKVQGKVFQLWYQEDGNYHIRFKDKKGAVTGIINDDAKYVIEKIKFHLGKGPDPDPAPFEKSD